MSISSHSVGNVLSLGRIFTVETLRRWVHLGSRMPEASVEAGLQPWFRFVVFLFHGVEREQIMSGSRRRKGMGESQRGTGRKVWRK